MVDKYYWGYNYGDWWLIWVFGVESVLGSIGVLLGLSVFLYIV